MTDDHTPTALTGTAAKELTGRKYKELTAQTSAMLESREVKAITGEQDEWWCPNPECEKIED